ncbi:hypothetical protein BDFB_014299, partial [Asbolus verrucosus]
MENLLTIVYHHHLVIKHVLVQNMVGKRNLLVLFWIVLNRLEYQPNPDVIAPFGNNQKCLVDGTEYKEGEQFYPQKTCLHCDSKEDMKNHFVKDKVVQYNLRDVQEQMFKIGVHLYTGKNQMDHFVVPMAGFALMDLKILKAMLEE